MDAKNGGPAFPVSTASTVDQESGAFGHQDGARTWQFPGMTLRDYFAAKAMHGYMAYIVSMETASMSRSHNEIAQEAYSIADAMLAARGDA